MSGLRYVGADLVLGRDEGPLLLELNARPGLAIQIANRSGLEARARLISAKREEVGPSPEQRVAWAMEHFTGP